MNEIFQFTKKLSTLGIELWAENNQLHHRCRYHQLSEDVLVQLRTFSPQLLSLLPYYSYQAPLSYGQQALWFISQNSPESSNYNISFSIRAKTDSLKFSNKY